MIVSFQNITLIFNKYSNLFYFHNMLFWPNYKWCISQIFFTYLTTYLTNFLSIIFKIYSKNTCIVYIVLDYFSKKLFSNFFKLFRNEWWILIIILPQTKGEWIKYSVRFCILLQNKDYNDKFIISKIFKIITKKSILS